MSTPAPGAGPPPPADPGPGIRELAAALRAAGLDPSAEELADALWLAGHAHTAAARGAAGPPPAPPGTGPRRDDTPARERGRPYGRRPAAPEPPPAAEDPLSLYVPGRPGTHPDPEPDLSSGTAVPVRVPAAAALPRILEIQRALRALQRHRPPAPPARVVLDEDATAEASARALGLAVPVLRAETRREATMRLVMDASPSMAVWQDMFEELRGVCERLGAFRDVQVHHLHRLPDGTPAVGRGPRPEQGLRSGDQLRDPTGRVLTMVVSDCAGPLWREGAAQRLLYRWAQCAPCVVVQPLPQRLWARSWLPTERGTLARVEGGGGRLRFGPDRPPRAGRPTGGLTVPVLPPSATALGAWARLVAGLGTGPVPAEVGRVLADHPAAPLPPPRAVRPPRELVRRFRSSASPRAVQLAVYLSATPLTLPVMRLVQRTMLPDSEPSDLAEVLLSGLLRRASEDWFTFAPGVQDVLLGPLGRDEAALVLKHCSEYVLQHFGRGVRNFPALAVSQLTGAPLPAATVPETDEQDPAAARLPAARLPQAFAQVSAKVVRRYLPGPPGSADAAEETGAAPPAPSRAWAVRTARARVAAHDRDGDTRPLHEAVAVLRRAAGAPPGPGDAPGEAEFELAGTLLRLWALQRDPELLAEAERTVRAVAHLPGMVRARAVLGRVLHERARDPAAEDVEELLAAADREFAAVAAVPDLERELRLDCAVRRARTLTRLSELRDDPAPLREALAALEAADRGERERGGKPDAALHLALGRVLLALTDRATGPEQRLPLAERAAARLETGLAALLRARPGTTPARTPAGTDPDRDGDHSDRLERARARLDLAAALRHLPERLDEAPGQLALALDEAAGEPELRLAGLVCLARVHRARHARDRNPAALEEAAEAYARARRLIPRDAEAYGELLPEWGDVLLDRARAADGRRFTSAAVRVLRDSRAAVPQTDPRAGRRLLRLAVGLRLRYAYEGDLVDLREAEYLLELAVRHSRCPLEQARAWREHGDVQQEIHAATRAPDRLDRAADSYRRAWRAALAAEREDRRDTALGLAARVQELRGEVLERLARPRAALDAYRAALDLWARLPGPDPVRRDAVRARIEALEAGL
ncbi:SAV_2336 N-terminal domain-related protein [Streptomyces sp. NPDC090022]|uniref:SAV_2336 N-terminal domain-related protein n=1 Tax=Streptomyces sp. NPDC090022 TaxID=3365920 RepID=UPI00381FA8C6